MPHTAAAIANLFLDLAKQSGKSEGMTPMKVQKLVFFAHGWHLAIKGQPLINEQVEAWKFGPVVPSLYRDLKAFGSGDVTCKIVRHGKGLFSGTRTCPTVPDSDASTREHVSDVWTVYSPFTGVQLSNITHYPGSPWSQVMKQYDGNPPKGTDIPSNVIRDYFASLSSQQQ
jgi:uncharacterized phage-associated protein